MTGSSSVVVTVTNPFVGPRFIETGQKIFGRDREIEQLYYLLSAERVVLLHSPSGAGKSSLIRAGLIPRLKEPFDVWGPTRVSLEPPEGCPIAANRFVQSVNLGFEAGLPEERQRPAKISAMGLSEHIAGRPRRRSASPNIVLIFDQFEEILTVDPLALEAKHEFFDQVGKLLQDPHVWALFALREDYLAPLDPYAEQVPTHLKNRFRLDLLGREAAGDVIARSVEEGGRTVAPEAVEKLVNNLATMQVQRPDGTFESQTGPYVEPLHLQVACRELWNRLPEDRRTIDVDDIQLFGDVTKALADYYEKEVAEIAGGDARVERAIREWVGERLITADGIRGQVLKGAGESEGLDNELIGRLVNTHLVRGEQRAGAEWYELSHDRLIEPVRTNNKEWFEAHLSKVQKVASVWETQGRPEGLLLLGGDLVEARQWAQVNESSLTGIERRFLEAPGAKQEAIRREQRQTKRLRLALWVASVLALAASLATWAAYRSAQSAHKSAQDADRNAAAAKRAEDDATNKAREAEEAKRNALAYAERATRSEKKAKDKAAEAVKETGIADEKTREARIALARSAVQDAGDALDLKNRPDQALAYAARALRVDPNSVVARNWLADLLLRQSWWLPEAPLQHKTGDYYVAFSADGRRIVTVSDDHTAQVWEADTGRPVGPPLLHKADVYSVAFSADGRRVVTTSMDDTAQVWEAATGKPVGAPLQHKNGFPAALSADGRRVVTASGDTAQVWEADTGKRVGDPLQHKYGVNFAAFSPDGRRVVTISNDNRVLQGNDYRVQVWEADTGKRVGDPLQHKHPVNSAAFSADGRRVVTISNDNRAQGNDNRAQVWETDTGKPVGAPLQYERSVSSAALSADGGRVVTASWWEDTVQVRETDTGKPVGEPMQHKGGVNSAAFSADGRWVVTASEDETAQVWEADTGKPVGAPLQHKERVYFAAFSVDGRRVVTASGDNTAQVWETDTGKPVAAALQFKGPVFSAASGADELRVEVASALNAPEGAFSADGRRVVTASGDTAQVWETDTGNPLRVTMQHKKAVNFAAFSVDGRRVVTISNHWAQVWDANTGKPVGAPLQPYEAEEVNSAAFSADGRRVLTILKNNRAQVWEADTGKRVGWPRSDKDRVNSAAL